MGETRDVIRERMLSNLSNNYDKLPGSWTWETYQAEAIELENIKILYEDSLNQRFAGTSDIENLKVIAFEKGVIWKEATYANGILKVTGTPNSTINIGDLFSNQLLEYAATESKTLDSNGIATFNAQCTTPGVIGNTPIGTITSFPKSLLGINTVTNELPFTNGYDEESRDSLLERYYLEIQKPATSGNIHHYEKWALSVDGVGAVKVKPTWNGGGTVKVVILNRNKEIADSTLITNTNTYITSQMPIGANLTVSTATELNINVTAKITLKQNYTINQAKTDIEKNINQYFKDNAFIDNNIYYAKVGNIIFNSEGVNNIDYSTFLLNNSKNDIILLDTNQQTQIAKLGTLTITV